MDKNTFFKGMEELLAVAKTNGSQITTEELLDYFSELSLDDEAKNLLFQCFTEAGIRVIGYEAANKEELEEPQVSEEEMGVIRYYEEELNHMELPGEEEQRKLLHRWFEGEDVGDTVINCLLPAVVEIAKKHKGQGVLFGDLIQEGNIGLLESMAVYQGKDEEEFLRSAKRGIEDAMLDAIAVQKGSDSSGKQMAVKANRLDEAATHLTKEFGRAPSAEELAQYLSMTVDEIKDIMKISLDAISVMETDITPAR